MFLRFDFRAQYNVHTGLVYYGTNTYNGALVCQMWSKILYCPSSTLPKKVLMGSVPGDGVQSATYVGISGAVDHATTLNRDSEGYEHFGKGQVSRGGVLLSHEAKKLTDIADGTSQTIVVAEQSDFCRNAAGTRIDCRSDFGHSFSMGPGWSGENRHWNLTTVRYRLNDKTWENQGVSNVYYGQNRPLQSAHPGGVNVLFGDGSVRMLQESMSLQTLFNMANRDDGNVFAQ